MKTLFTLLLAFICLSNFASTFDNNINPILKNKSFIEKFGIEPSSTTDEILRIQTHLEYVENLLRNTKTKGLSKTQQTNRVHLLDLLHTYWQAVIFPKNYDMEERKPCFIDKDGAICAVGYLVEQTAGRDMAEYINTQYQYANIKDIHLAKLNKWIKDSGLSLEECAMIQPNYTPTPFSYPYPNNPTTGAIAASICFTGLNTYNSIVHLNHSLTNDGKNKNAIAGVFLGVSQIGWGIANYSVSKNNQNPIHHKTLFATNLLSGSVAILSSGFNYITNRKPKTSKKNHIGLFTYPIENNLVYGLQWNRGL